MTTEQALKAIASHIEPYFEPVPQRLLNNIAQIINQTRTIVRREVVMPDRKKMAPDMQAEWLKICEIHCVDPVLAKRGRVREKISAKAHFVRYLLLNFEYINMSQIARFFGNDHTTIIHLRDKSKVPCPIPPFHQKKRFLINDPAVPA